MMSPPPPLLRKLLVKIPLHNRERLPACLEDATLFFFFCLVFCSVDANLEEDAPLICIIDAILMALEDLCLPRSEASRTFAFYCFYCPLGVDQSRAHPWRRRSWPVWVFDLLTCYINQSLHIILLMCCLFCQTDWFVLPRNSLSPELSSKCKRSSEAFSCWCSSG